MKFSKDHKVILSSMNKTEAQAFVLFLDSEILRHAEDIKSAGELRDKVVEKFGLVQKDIGK